MTSFPHRLLAVAVLLAAGAAPAQRPFTQGDQWFLFTDFDRLMQPVDQESWGGLPPFEMLQFTSFDRRSHTRDHPDWFSNSDGFGSEPIPNFAEVLEEPGADGVGRYLLCDVEGPGAVVRTWSAGMQGELRVELDGQEVFVGPAYDFLARKTDHFLPDLDPGIRKWTVQQDADYLPLQFGERLRMTWRGNLRELHFYYVQVKRYTGSSAGFVTGLDVGEGTAPSEAAVERMRSLQTREPGDLQRWQAELAPGERDARVFEEDGLGVVRWLELRVAVPEPVQGEGLSARDRRARQRARALRGTLLQVFCDGAQVPHVDAPIGDFFGSGIGDEPLWTPGLEVRADGTRICRFPMPFRDRIEIRLTNHSGAPVAVEGGVQAEPLSWNAGVLGPEPCRFRARWRVDHELAARGGADPIDLPFLVAIGEGRLVGAASMLCNPVPDPRQRSNWWGEGDEKVFVDGGSVPRMFGTGSEDYYNYSWSRWDRFDHPFCGQPLDTGPGNCGYVSNHRFHILDDVPFRSSLAFTMELWSHRPIEPLSYGRICWWYGAVGAVDDHRRLQPAELRVPELPPWSGDPWSGEGETTVRRMEDLEPEVSGGEVVPLAHRLTRSATLLEWRGAARGDTLTAPVTVAERARYVVHLTALHVPGGATLAGSVGGRELVFRDVPEGGGGAIALRSGRQERLLGIRTEGVWLDAGMHDLVLTCAEPGAMAFDHVHLRLVERRALVGRGGVAAAGMEVVDASEGVVHEVQRLSGDRWSGGRHLWVKPVEAGQHVTLRVPVEEPGQYEVLVRLTRSWDYGILRIARDGRPLVEGVDTYNGERRAVDVLEPVELGTLELDGALDLRFEVTGSNPEAEAPGVYFGIDGVILRRAQ